MSDARFKVVFSGPLVTLQDAGRPGFARFGAPASGPMDRLSHAAANCMLGREKGATCIEVSLGGLVLQCVEGEATLALAGGCFSLEAGGLQADGWSVATVSAGDRITVRAGPWGGWGYLAFCGDIVANRWLGAAATHSTSGLGGGIISTGDEIRVEAAVADKDRAGAYAIPRIAAPLGEVRIVMGPQDHHFAAEASAALTTTPYRLTDAFDRMGVRLEGEALVLGDALSVPSEPIVRGSIQVSGDGAPTVLLADHQTTGGYPKIATVISSDIDRLAQNRTGDELRFVAISPKEAVAAARHSHRLTEEALAEVAAPRPTMNEQLLRENLISGVIAG